MSELKYNKIVLEVEDYNTEFLLNSFYLQYLPPTNNEFYPYILNYFKTFSAKINEFFSSLPSIEKNLIILIKIFLFPFTDKKDNVKNFIEEFYSFCEREKLLIKGQFKPFLLRYFEICTIDVNKSFATALEPQNGVQDEVFLEPTESYFGPRRVEIIVNDLLQKKQCTSITKEEFYQIFRKLYQFKSIRDYTFYTYEANRINK